MSVLIETTLGDIVVDLYVKERPQTSKNFLKLCKMKYYNYCVFHSIQQNFIAQTGDPTGTGRGGDSVFSLLFGEQARYFEQENIPQLKHIKRGTLSMVNNGQDCNGSQFFLTLSENLDYLDGSHSVFGEVAEGWSTLEKLNDVICDGNNRPYIDVRITHTIVLDDPFPNDKNLHMPSRSPSPSLELLKTARIGVDEDLDETQGKSAEEIREEMEDKEAKARAHVLEMVGDLHHAEEKPPDNVLFVCKLNSVTTEEDLEIIFSRFGKITCCEIIKDKKTGNSLQYAFIEFEKPEHCENAYFKMDNVLIDDRRIHVDFSQSVSKNFQWNRQVSGTKREENEKELVKKPNKEHKKKPSRSRSPQFAARRNFEEKKHHHQYRTHEKPSDYRNARRRDSRSRSKTPPKRKHHKHKN